MIHKNQQKKFIKWATFWHGDHENCDVANTLKKFENNEASFADVFNAVVDTEGLDWEESWKQFLGEPLKEN